MKKLGAPRIKVATFMQPSPPVYCNAVFNCLIYLTFLAGRTRAVPAPSGGWIHMVLGQLGLGAVMGKWPHQGQHSCMRPGLEQSAAPEERPSCGLVQPYGSTARAQSSCAGTAALGPNSTWLHQAQAGLFPSSCIGPWAPKAAFVPHWVPCSCIKT